MIAPASKLPRPHRVLIVKPSSLGDVVTALPVLRGLRRSFPEVHIAWLISARCAALIDGDSQLDEIILFDRDRLGRAWRSPAAAWHLARLLRTLRRGSFDWVIDLQGLLRSGLLSAATLAPVRAGFADAREAVGIFYTHRIDAGGPHTVDRNINLARHLGIDARPEDMTLEVASEARTFAEEFCRGRNVKGGKFIICVPPTRWATKRYPPRHWRKVVAGLVDHAMVVLLGTKADRLLCETIAEGMGLSVVNMAGRTTIPEMVALIAASGGVICNDSASKFVAPAVGVEAITLIGPTRPDLTGPYGGGKAIVADVPCQGCLRRRCKHTTCMELIDPVDVISAGIQLLGARSA